MQRAFTICMKIFQFWKHFQLTDVVERDLTAHGEVVVFQTWLTGAEISGEQVHQPAVIVW